MATITEGVDDDKISMLQESTNEMEHFRKANVNLELSLKIIHVTHLPICNTRHPYFVKNGGVATTGRFIGALRGK